MCALSTRNKGLFAELELGGVAKVSHCLPILAHILIVVDSHGANDESMTRTRRMGAPSAALTQTLASWAPLSSRAVIMRRLDLLHGPEG